MRAILRFSFPIFALLMLVFTSSCGDGNGPGGGGVVLPPVVSLNTGTDLVSGPQDLELGTPSFAVSISGRDGDAPLRDLRIEENGFTIPASRLTFRGGQTANNPILIAGTDQTNFVYVVDISTAGATAGESNYTFTLTDSDGESDAVSITINYTQVAPGVELIIEDGFVSGDALINTFSRNFSVRVRSEAIGADLQSLSVLENGVLLPENQLVINGGDVESDNPLVFATGEMSGTPTYRIRITPTGRDNDTKVYTFRAADINGVIGETSVNVTFATPMGTALTLDTMGVFFNSAGTSPGGLDLDSGATVGRSSTESEVRDQGLNLRVSSGENWRRQIGPANMATMRLANIRAIGDGVSFNTVLVQEEIAIAYNEGSELNGDDDFPNPSTEQSGDVGGNGENVTLPLVGGDAMGEGEIFAVKKGDRFYLLRIDEVRAVANSNQDSYLVSIKW